MNPDPRSRRFLWLLPCGLAFLSNFGVMAVEMVAGRMMAKHVGSSLYTWTSVIGVVLAGITVGNFLGGRLADRFDVRKTLAVLFSLAAVSTATIPLVNNAVGFWSRWDMADPNRSWPYRIAVHTALTFFLPSATAGLLGPVIAKTALDLGFQKGRTVGNVYAWGALGSIAGTFAAGFFLIASMGMYGVLYAVAGALSVLGILVAPRPALWVVVTTWPLVVACAYVESLPEPKTALGWSLSEGRLNLQESVFPDTIFENESQYSYLRVTENRADKTRRLYLDNLVHAIFAPDDPLRLEYGYEQVYAVITRRFGRSREDLRALFLGGGGYVFPRYVRALWPGSTLKVSEIDPAVTEANFSAFGLRRDEVRIMSRKAQHDGSTGSAAGPKPIEIYHMDARNHVEELLAEKRERNDFQPFDFIYGDAFSDFSVPYHLVTKEFALKLKDLLRPGTGMYLANVIDIYATAHFLGTLFNTLRQVFPSVYVVTIHAEGPDEGPNARDTFIIVAALEKKDLEDLGTRDGYSGRVGALLKEDQLRHLERQSRGIVLTDDYAPVENLLEIVIRRRGMLGGRSEKAPDGETKR